MNRETGEPVNDSAGVPRPDGVRDAGRFFREKGLAAEIVRIAEPVIEGLGFRLVRVQISGQDGQTVQIMAERLDGTMTIEDCETLSRDLSAVLDTIDPVRGAYRLEISSPGIDRPLVRPSDFEDWAGHEARIELTEAISGRKRWRGQIEGIEDGEVRMVCEIEGMGRQTVGFPLALIAEGKLVLTDELVREALRSAKRGDRDVSDPSAADRSVEKVGRKPGGKKQPGKR